MDKAKTILPKIGTRESRRRRPTKRMSLGKCQINFQNEGRRSAEESERRVGILTITVYMRRLRILCKIKKCGEENKQILWGERFNTNWQMSARSTQDCFRRDYRYNSQQNFDHREGITMICFSLSHDESFQ